MYVFLNRPVTHADPSALEKKKKKKKDLMIPFKFLMPLA